MDKSWQGNSWNEVEDFLGDDFFSEFQGLLQQKQEQEPKANLYMSGKNIICIFTLPGLTLEDVEIYAEKKTIEIRGTRHLDYPGFRLLQEEIEQGPFKRTLELPYSIEVQEVKSSYQKGVLMIHLLRASNEGQKK
ncbi:Hsp20/alpha crystallin family protein [Bacillus alkalicellulosilyticus]|uniref:Hsp20/alpha crystallin family protein n=1 Tax=Alkalihalobacterium alkalicellulosilyticum TaxID=1912214 RepID=UPI0014820EAB|nr:Hsp20/alpha crystallin family protein [Bacillus alkalicellulosilyticus]